MYVSRIFSFNINFLRDAIFSMNFQFIFPQQALITNVDNENVEQTQQLTSIDENQLKELGIKTIEKKK